MKTLLIEWTEISRHSTTVQVPVDADADKVIDLESRLAELVDDGFICLRREIGSVATVEHDPTAQVLLHPDPMRRRARVRP
jgi:hypothetical protein